MANFNAWRFNHPDFDQAASNSGLYISTSGAINMIAGVGAVRQSVLLLLTTMPGERINRPDYGCDLNKLIFMPNDATTQGLAMHYVRQAISRWEPRVRIMKIDATANQENPGVMDIILDYQVIAEAFNDELLLSFNLSELDS